MNINTENTIKSIFAVDETIPKDRIDGAIRILRGDYIPETKPIQVLRFAEVAALLGVSRRSVTNYIQAGHLDLVYGSGATRAYGVTMDSYSRMIQEQSRNRNPPSPDKELKKIEAARAKADDKSRILNGKIWAIRRLLKLDRNATSKERYAAIARVLESTDKYSASLVCKAAGIKLTAYIKQRSRPQNPWAIQRKKEEVAVQIIRANLESPDAKVGLLEAHRIVRDHGIPIAVKTIAKLLDSNGFTREKKGTDNDQ